MANIEVITQINDLLDANDVTIAKTALGVLGAAVKGTGDIVNADISATAAINVSKLTSSSATAGFVLTSSGTAAAPTFQAVTGTGDVVGPANATGNAIARFNSTTGKVIKNSLVSVSDTGAITAPAVGSIIPFYYANQSAFPSATTYHGALAHSHADAAMYFAHGGAWTKLQNDDYSSSLDMIPTTSAIRSYTSRDTFNGTQSITADNTTITSTILGTIKTVESSGNGKNLWSKSDGALVMFNPNSLIGIKDGATITHTAGFTGIAYIRIKDAKNHATKIGFTSSSFLPSGYYRVHQGVVIGSIGSGQGNTVRGITSSAGAILDGSLMSGVRDNDVIGIAVQLTASGFDVWMQGGPCDSWGASCGTAAWVKIWEYTGGTIAGNLAFGVETSNGGGPTCLLEFATTSSFVPDERTVKSLYRSTVKYNTHASNCHYDKAGNLWTVWWAGLGIDAEPTGGTYLRVRTPSGIWSSTVLIDGEYAVGSGYQGDGGSFIELPNGTLWLVKQRSIDAETTYTMTRVPLSVTAAGVVTVGSPLPFTGITQPFILNYQHPVVLASGRILLPCNTLTQPGNVHNWCVIYSDDSGSTWTQTALYGGAGGPAIYANETAIVEEGSSRQLAAYIRRAASPNGVYTPTPRYISNDQGATWTESGSIEVPSADNRAQAIRLDNGLVAYIANDSQTNYVRSNTTIWLLGDGGVTIGKIPVHPDTGSGQNYPSITARGDQLAVVMPVRQNIAGISPAQVFVMDQSLGDWMRSTRDRFNQSWRTAGAEAVVASDYLTAAVTSASAVSFLTGGSNGIVSISLTPGTWLVEGNLNVNFTSATVTELQAGIVTSGSPTDGTEVFTNINTTTLTHKVGITLPRKRMVLNATTTIYLSVKAQFSAGTAAGFGSITASRQ